MIQKIEVYAEPGPVRGLVERALKYIGRGKEYHATVTAEGYNLFPALATNPEVLRLKVATSSSGIDYETVDMLKVALHAVASLAKVNPQQIYARGMPSILEKELRNDTVANLYIDGLPAIPCVDKKKVSRSRAA